jgi:hypothetical protein
MGRKKMGSELKGLYRRVEIVREAIRKERRKQKEPPLFMEGTIGVLDYIENGEIDQIRSIHLKELIQKEEKNGC